MHPYDLIAILLIGISHILFYLLLIRYQSLSYWMTAIVSIIFTILLLIVVTITGYPEFNIIMLLLFLLSLGLMKKNLTFKDNLFFALMSVIGLTYTKSFLLVISIELFMLSSLNLYVWTFSLIHFIVTLVILISLIIGQKKIGKFAQYIVDSKLYYVCYGILLLGLLFGFILNYPASHFLATLHQEFGEASYFITVILFFVFVLIIVLGSHLAKERLLQEQEDKLEQEMLSYVAKLESAHEELASFRHDYLNILTSLEGSIHNNNLEEIKQVYNDTVAPTAQIISNQELDITKISLVLIPAVKSVLSVKITSAHQQQISVLIDIPEKIKSIRLPHTTFIRMITILLDNAIEEAALSKEKILQIALFELDSCLYVVVQNSCQSDTIDIHELFQKGYTNKGEHRGYGLYSFKRMIETYDYLSLETTFSAPYLTQTLIIKQQ